MRSRFLPEGRLLHASKNEAACASRGGPRRTMEEEAVLKGVAQLCDGTHNLLVSIGPFTGFLPREEAAPGIAKGTTREIAILFQVGKPVYFQTTALEGSGDVLRPRLSRRRARQATLGAILTGLHPGYILPTMVAHLGSFRAFTDIGCGIPSLIGIEDISVSRIPHPDQWFRVGQAIFIVIQELDPKPGRVYLTHRELLGAQAEDAVRSQADMTVPGIVRRPKKYRVFVELTPNLSDLTERKSGLRKGDRMSVYVKTVLPKRVGIKLLAIGILPPLNVPTLLECFLTREQIEKQRYAPEGCVKVGAETIFA